MGTKIEIQMPSKSNVFLQDLELQLFGSFADEGSDSKIDVMAIEKKLADTRAVMASNKIEEAALAPVHEDPELKALKEAIGNGRIDISSGIGQIFTREHRPGTAANAKYNESRLFTAKANYRLEWATQRYETKCQQASQSK